LNNAIKKFEKMSFDAKDINKYAKNFSKEKFSKEILKFINEN
jgi:hypothetical protein